MASGLSLPRPSRPELLVALVAGDSGLSRRGLTALTRLRARQLEIQQGSRGAFVKLVPNAAPPLLSLGQIGRDSPLSCDYHSLVVLELAREFPAHGAALRGLIDARRHGLDLPALAFALWQDDGDTHFESACRPFGCDPHLLAATLCLALKPLYELVARSFSQHFELPQGGTECPVCGGTPYARCGELLRCAVCEQVWQGELPGPWREVEGPQATGARRIYQSQTGQRLLELEESLFAESFNTAMFVELLLALERDG